MLDGLRKHLGVAVEAWKSVSAEKNEPTINPEFLPAALEIAESPASKGSRYFMWAIIAIFTCVIGWAFLGKVDVVVVAPGKLIPEGRVKTIQASSEGIVEQIFVHNGDHVNKGDVLFELNSIESESSVDQAQARLLASAIDQNHWSSIFTFIDTGKMNITYPESASSQQRINLENQVNGDITSYQYKVEHLKKQAIESMSEKIVVESQLAQTMKSLPILKDKLDIYESLKAKGVSTDIDYYDIKRQYISQSEEVNVQRSQINKAVAAHDAVQTEILQTQADFRSHVLDMLNKASNEVLVRQEDLVKASERDHEHHIRAPVSGTVEQSQLTTIGGVVKGAEPLMVVVPDNVDLVFEGKIRNQDIGYIRHKQDVEIKLNAFPYTRFGVINGKLTEVSHDAVEDKKEGLVFTSLSHLERQTMQINGTDVRLTPGMDGTIEIKTGKRRIIEYFLSPLLEVSDESFKER
ncbi:Hemolysin secretion protein D, plasmid [BD1-7 clade bacterium]|uniref:Membrane fusion protein (MFP) family protein n=1 Tax=BD1-7 clade bacterium TaxID=2029982 RepID=A0A5S9NVI6_9GAMM|nr:Hemolysin secretion protein D, plasmid [BD1-7 clade bacterium]CAA0095399.1 Hemolysin secretion protein D, plasmid [BD1-7 clade bacterium]